MFPKLPPHVNAKGVLWAACDLLLAKSAAPIWRTYTSSPFSGLMARFLALVSSRVQHDPLIVLVKSTYKFLFICLLIFEMEFYSFSPGWSAMA